MAHDPTHGGRASPGRARRESQGPLAPGATRAPERDRDDPDVVPHDRSARSEIAYLSYLRPRAVPKMIATKNMWPTRVGNHPPVHMGSSPGPTSLPTKIQPEYRPRHRPKSQSRCNRDDLITPTPPGRGEGPHIVI